MTPKTHNLQNEFLPGTVQVYFILDFYTKSEQPKPGEKRRERFMECKLQKNQENTSNSKQNTLPKAIGEL